MGLMFQHQAGGDELRPEEAVRLFEQNFAPQHDLEEALDLSLEMFEIAWPMAKDLFLGATDHIEELDKDIDEAAINWSINRMSMVDLALLRLAYYEMRYRTDIPPLVSLNEAIELAKDFGDAYSTAFINGILDRLLNRIEVKS
jgi:transcription antitermination factor NusB